VIVKVDVSLEHNNVLDDVAVKVGRELTSKDTSVNVEEQPVKEDVPTTLYVVVIVGLTTIVDVVSPLGDHK
jgi:hypothetical protein